MSKEQQNVSGIVVLREILSLDEQIRLINIVERKGGLRDEDGKLNFVGRGRNFCGISKYSNEEDFKFIDECCKRFKQSAENADNTLTWPNVTHVLTYFYPETKGLPWHVDDYGGNNGDVGAPVYSLSLGNTCVFEYKLVGGNGSKNIVELNSGDLIVFGGQQRELMHTVSLVKKGTFDKIKNFDARINLTFRTCTGFSDDDEAFYQTDVYLKRLQEKWRIEKEENHEKHEKQHKN
jgi:hypothetical protein